MQSSTIKNLVTDDLTYRLDKMAVTRNTPDDILQGLSESIGKIDFQILAFPEIVQLRQKIEDLELIIYTDGILDEDKKSEVKEYRGLTKKLKYLKLTKNHYLILCVEQLLQIAKENNWGLCKKHGYIYLYNGEFWTEIDKERFQFFLGNVALKMGVEKFKGKIHTFKEELFKQFLADAYLPTPRTKKDSVLINLQNGTFEITSKKRGLREFDQNDFITHQLPFEYLPQATAPLFQNFLNEVIPDPEKQKVLAEYCGSIFIKSSVLKLEKMLVLYGTGANGKSVFFEIISALLGSENVSNYSLQSLTNENGYYRAKIANKLVNYASEITGKLDSNYFKQMSSGEPVDARLPYGEPFLLNEYAKLIFNCNELPKDVEHTEAYFRRFTIIGFDVTIPEEKQDKELATKIITSELSGVFNWILEGLDRLLAQRNFTTCKAIEEARTTYKNESDSVKMFMEENGYERSAETYTLIQDIYPQYRLFCLDEGVPPVKKSNFRKRLSHHGFYVKRITKGWIAYAALNNDLDLDDIEF